MCQLSSIVNIVSTLGNVAIPDHNDMITINRITDGISHTKADPGLFNRVGVGVGLGVYRPML